MNQVRRCVPGITGRLGRRLFRIGLSSHCRYLVWCGRIGVSRVFIARRRRCARFGLQFCASGSARPCRGPLSVECIAASVVLRSRICVRRSCVATIEKPVRDDAREHVKPYAARSRAKHLLVAIEARELRTVFRPSLLESASPCQVGGLAWAEADSLKLRCDDKSDDRPKLCGGDQPE